MPEMKVNSNLIEDFDLEMEGLSHYERGFDFL